MNSDKEIGQNTINPCVQYFLFELITSFVNFKYQVGVDMIGPLPQTENGNRYIITLVDYFSKWPEAEAVPDKSAITVARFLTKVMLR